MYILKWLLNIKLLADSMFTSVCYITEISSLSHTISHEHEFDCCKYLKPLSKVGYIFIRLK